MILLILFFFLSHIFMNHEVTILTFNQLARRIFIGFESLHDEFKRLNPSWSQQDGVISKTEMIYLGGPSFHDKSMIVLMIMESI